MDILTYGLIAGAAVIGAIIGFFGYKKTLTTKAHKFKERMSKARELEEEIIENAKKKAEKVLDQAEERAQKIEDQRTKKIEEIQNRLLTREEKLDEKLEKIEQDREKLTKKEKEIDTIIEQQNAKLAEIAKFKPEEAKQELFNNIEALHQQELTTFVEKLKTIQKEEAETESAKIIARALPRVAADNVSEFTTVMVDLPNEDYKGKLIGREGRNINFFEKISGVELIVDDTPLVVRLSCYDHEKRFIAIRALERLIKDGRINPHYIEKIYNETVNDLDNILMEKGKEALSKLNLPMMKPDIVKYIGQFFLRYSYGQNLWNHSIEVAKISEAIATEVGLDPILAKKAGLLHDIGKVIADTGQSHTAIGAEVLKKYSMDDVIVNAAASHHYDVPMTHAISWVVTAADAASASRPGARFNTKELFIEKMTELEKLINTVDGVDKVHIMQAGREIMVYVQPDEVNDKGVEVLLKTIGKKIEDQLDYPGIIRVTGIRETKVIEYLR